MIVSDITQSISSTLQWYRPYEETSKLDLSRPQVSRTNAQIHKYKHKYINTNTNTQIYYYNTHTKSQKQRKYLLRFYFHSQLIRKTLILNRQKSMWISRSTHLSHANKTPQHTICFQESADFSNSYTDTVILCFPLFSQHAFSVQCNFFSMQ